MKAVEDQHGKHGKPLDDPEAAIAELGGERDLTVDVAKPAAGTPHVFSVPAGSLPSYELGDEVATRKAYGESIAALADIRGDVVALDGEVSNSTHSEDFRKAHPDRYFEMFIAEQQLVAAAVGMQVRGWTPFVSTFAAFLSRAYDFVRMAAISRAQAGAERLARRRLDRRGRPVADGAGGHGLAARDPRLDRRCTRATPTRPRRSSRPPPTSRASRSSARCAARRRCARRAGEARIGGSRIAHEGDDVAIIACGITRRRGGQGRRAARFRRRARARARRLLDQADRRRRPSTPRRATAARSSPSRTTPPRAASATPSWTRSPRATSAPTWSSSPCARSPAPARPRSCCTARRSTPTRSPTRRQARRRAGLGVRRPAAHCGGPAAFRRGVSECRLKGPLRTCPRSTRRAGSATSSSWASRSSRRRTRRPGPSGPTPR